MNNKQITSIDYYRIMVRIFLQSPTPTLKMMEKVFQMNQKKMMAKQ